MLSAAAAIPMIFMPCKVIERITLRPVSWRGSSFLYQAYGRGPALASVVRCMGRVVCSDDEVGHTRLSLASVSASSAICKSMLTIRTITNINVLKALLPGKRNKNTRRRWHAEHISKVVRQVVKIPRCQQMLWTGCCE